MIYVHGAEVGSERVGRRDGFYGIATAFKGGAPAPIDRIEAGYRRLVAHAQEHADEIFILPPLGVEVGQTAFSRREIGEMVRRVGIPENVMLARTWLVDG